MGDFAARAQLEDSEEERWHRAGAELRDALGPDQWRAAGTSERIRLLSEIHDRLRPSFDLSRRTELVFAVSVEGDGAGRGMGYDEETGRYILVAIAELEREEPGALIGGLAHELRHAFQHEARDGVVEDIRTAEWRDAYATYETEGPGYKYNALEIDAERAQAGVGAGYAGE